jgi:hypothetical protein
MGPYLYEVLVAIAARRLQHEGCPSFRRFSICKHPTYTMYIPPTGLANITAIPVKNVPKFCSLILEFQSPCLYHLCPKEVKLKYQRGKKLSGAIS